jgi:hypothetical protein
MTPPKRGESKGDAALVVHITLALSREMRRRLGASARADGFPVATQARHLLLAGLRAWEQEENER